MNVIAVGNSELIEMFIIVTSQNNGFIFRYLINHSICFNLKKFKKHIN